MNVNKKMIGLAIAFLLLIAVGGLLSMQINDASTKSDAITSDKHVVKQLQVKDKSIETSATIAGIGDILLHDRVYEDAEKDGSYDFAPMFAGVKDILNSPDFLIANQESAPGGTKIGLSTYPSFNSPHEIVDTLQDVGVDVVTTANNHSIDRGEKGLLSAIDYYEKVSMPYVGTFKNPEDQATIRTFNVNGIKFALLSYTYGTNGIPVPSGKEYLVNLIDENNMINEVKRARELDVDMVVMSLHWGNEYERFPNEEQKRLGKLMTDSGVDIILGHHPHVLQPIEKVKTEDGREAVIVYSLGNFLSGQKDDYKDIGGMAVITVNKTIQDGRVTLSYPSVDFEPTYVSQQGNSNYRLHPLSEAHKKGLISNSAKEINTHMFEGIAQ
ncbi:CapA family protein [Rossellomorea marisflavi]|uniref:CapA family protein n=1 Tax=Rossellomorea marisflavi TaxID=189381 RepID=UPI0034577F04